MRTLIMDCSGFVLEHPGYVINEAQDVIQRIQCPTTEIAGFAANTPGVKKIILTGHTDYCLGVKETVEKQLALEYAFNDIEIEVM